MKFPGAATSASSTRVAATVCCYLGAAQHLGSGRAVGVDLWAAKDQADNRPEATLRNAILEGVGGRVERHGDIGLGGGD